MPAGGAAWSVERIAAVAGEAEAGARPVNDLGLDLLRRNTGLGHGNVALSPWSIGIALAMARVGARGPTAVELERVLHTADAAALDQAMNALDQALRSRNRSTWISPHEDALVVDLSAANRLFSQAGLNLLPDFLDTLAARYGASVGQVDYEAATEAGRQAINGWVGGETRDRIPELIGEGVLDVTTRLVLVNAVHLRADWATAFSTGATSDGKFHTPTGDVTVPFMCGTGRRGWSEGDGWRAVELTYTGDELAMIIVVPDAGHFDRVAAAFDRALLERVATTQSAEVRVRLPKFDVGRPVMLGEQLRRLGIALAFSDDADFSGITLDEPLRMAEVVHQANVTVDERGTVAAAGSAMIAEAMSGLRADGKEIDVDRPFLFLLRDRITGALVFAGQVTNPA